LETLNQSEAFSQPPTCRSASLVAVVFVLPTKEQEMITVHVSEARNVFYELAIIIYRKWISSGNELLSKMAR